MQGIAKAASTSFVHTGVCVCVCVYVCVLFCIKQLDKKISGDIHMYAEVSPQTAAFP